MPRKRPRTRTGEEPQNVKSVPGQRYGEGVEQQALQRAMPAPDVTGNVPSPQLPNEPIVGPGGQGPLGDPAMLTEYLGANNPNLFAGSQRPDEPITSGLSTGPGPDQQVLSMGRTTTPIGRFFERLATETGDPRWRHLQERASM